MRGNRLKDTTHVLVIEDEPGENRLLEKVSHPNASDFYYVSSGEEALQYLRRQGAFESSRRPNLIVLDLNAKQSEFIRVVTEVKADPELRIVPIIVFSTVHSDGQIREAYSGHAACVVKRPTDANEYLSVCQGIARFWLRFVCFPPITD